MTLHDGPSGPAPIAVQFWGVRGSIACPGPRRVALWRQHALRRGPLRRAHADLRRRHRHPRTLGNALVKSANTTDFDIFLSHGHIDHVVGLAVFRAAVREEPGGSRVGRQPAAGGRREGGRAQADELSVLSAAGRRAAGATRISRLPRRRRHQAASGHRAAHRAAQSSGRRHRLSRRLRRTLDGLRHRCRDRRGRARSGAGRSGQGRVAPDPRHDLYRARNCPHMPAGAIRAGSRASRSPTPPAPGGFACSTTIPTTTTMSWTGSPPRPRPRGPARWSRAKG